MENYRIIIKQVRIAEGFTIKQAAKHLGIGVGSLCEIESGKGRAKFDEARFEELLQKYGGEKYKVKFKKWVYAQKYTAPKSDLYIGPALKHYRLLANIKQKDVANAVGMSPATVSMIEQGKAMASSRQLKKFLELYKIGEKHFKQCSMPRDVKSQKIPANLRLQFLCSQLCDDELQAVIEYSQNLRNNNQKNQGE